jgi:hypothetical protein
LPGPAFAQETAAEPAAVEPAAAPDAAAPAAVAEEIVLLTEEELDALVAPVALYPDSLLIQVLIASTYPVEVVMADRWVARNEALTGTARSEAAATQEWDPSVQVLAAGFPSVLTRMAEDLEWTQALGDAMLVQSEDVLDAVQRMRARAQAMGNLETNQAQTVTVEGDNITIAPASPEVVYVPTYTEQVYTSTSPAPVTVVQTDDDDWDTGSAVVGGLIGFTTGLIVAEIFDDDDY